MTEPTKTFKWRKPEEVMALHMLKKKKKALQARISMPTGSKPNNTNPQHNFESISAAAKRKNPFICNDSNKKLKTSPECEGEESQDSSLFTLYKFTKSSNLCDTQSIPDKIVKADEVTNNFEIVKAAGKRKIPVDWTLKKKMRLMSLQPFKWNQKLKISEEASGTTGFARCLDIKSNAPFLDTSSNAKFHQCCLYWQHPYFPWLELYPRVNAKSTNQCGVNLNQAQTKQSLHMAWSDSLRNLFQLLRTRQCAYFYMCSNTFTVLFRAAGVCGTTEMNALITPTTRGFRQVLRQEEIEFSMPLKKKRISDTGLDADQNSADSGLPNELEDDDDEAPNEDWLKSFGCREEDIKKINYTNERILQKMECEVDKSEQSLVLVEGVEVQALYNFLINCKSTISTTGPLAGVPPTLLAPVAFHGSTMNGLKVRQSKMHSDSDSYYSIELTGPILPHTVHNLFAINPPEHSVTATFANDSSTEAFSKVLCKVDDQEERNEELTSSSAFGKAGLSDCGLYESIIDRFCSKDNQSVTNIECLKYTSEDSSYSWT